MSQRINKIFISACSLIQQDLAVHSQLEPLKKWVLGPDLGPSTRTQDSWPYNTNRINTDRIKKI